MRDAGGVLRLTQGAAQGWESVKIAVISGRYVPQERWGSARSLKILLDALTARGHEPFVVSLAPNTDPMIRRIDGIKVHYLQSNERWRSVELQQRRGWIQFLSHLKDATDLLTANRIMDVLESESPDLVQSVDLRGLGTLVWRKLKVHGVPVVHTLQDYHLACPYAARFHRGHSCRLSCVRCAPTAAWYRMLSRDVDAVVGISQFILDFHSRRGYFPNAVRWQMIPHATYLRPRRQEASYHRAPTTFGFLGRLAPESGIELLLQSLIGLKSSRWRLIVGGNEREAYRAELARTYFHPSIEWSGPAAWERVLDRSDCVVVPSLWNEPQSRAILDSLSSGVPPLVSRRGGATEIIRDGVNGFLIDPDDPQDLRDRLRSIVDGTISPASLRASCLDTARRLSPENLALGYEGVYREVTSRASRQVFADKPAVMHAKPSAQNPLTRPLSK